MPAGILHEMILNDSMKPRAINQSGHSIQLYIDII